MTESERFRKLLEQFYYQINTGSQLNIFKKLLTEQLDEVEVEPIHILTLTQEPSFKQIPEKKKIDYTNKAQCLYKSSDFASVFLFAFLLEALKRGESEYFEEIEARIEANLKLFYHEDTTEDAIRYKLLFSGIIEFCRSLSIRSYRPQQVEKLLKAFYNSSIERKGVKKSEREKYGTEAQIIVSFILGEGGYLPSKKEVTDHTSDAYECNTINFCINIQNVMEREEWTIGEGENIINIVMEKSEFSVFEDVPPQQETLQQENLNHDWLKILAESKKIKEEQSEKTSKLLTDLNIPHSHSPSKSIRSPKSANYNGLRKTKNNFI